MLGRWGRVLRGTGPRSTLDPGMAPALGFPLQLPLLGLPPGQEPGRAGAPWVPLSRASKLPQVKSFPCGVQHQGPESPPGDSLVQAAAARNPLVSGAAAGSLGQGARAPCREASFSLAQGWEKVCCYGGPLWDTAAFQQQPGPALDADMRGQERRWDTAGGRVRSPGRRCKPTRKAALESRGTVEWGGTSRRLRRSSQRPRGGGPCSSSSRGGPCALAMLIPGRRRLAALLLPRLEALGLAFPSALSSGSCSPPSPAGSCTGLFSAPGPCSHVGCPCGWRSQVSQTA